MSRSTAEWVGKTDDAKVPPRVRKRIFDAHDGICHITGRKIMPGEPWDLEHKVALILGGENREKNLAPALRDPHKKKTAAELKVRAKIDAVRKRHLGITQPKGKMQSAGFAPSDKPKRGVCKDELPPLPRRQLFAKAAM